ncbi:MAG: MmgE/PrpD family protein [Thermodesulfobacteriota bacterium]
MSNETVRLAEFAAGLDYDDVPASVRQRARDSIADTIATTVFGRDLPWSRIVIDYARRMGSGGRSRILGDGDVPVIAPFAALANGVLAHAFELDGAVRPSAGAHPGATILSAALALAQERGFGGKDLLTAFVAGSEVMIRIGRATKHSNETRGFHAPGTTGPFGAAVACGKLLGFDARQMTSALGIAGSLSAGLVEFSRSNTGAMVKRLHFGRAAEGGLLAANLAAAGFTGPQTVLEGECGFLRVFCDEWDASELTRELGSRWLTSRISMKRFACHTASHTPVQAILGLKRSEGLQASQVASIIIEAGEKALSRHNIKAPADVMIGQYSIPFCVALALVADPTDPRTFRDADVADARIRSLADRIRLVPWASSAPPSPIATLTTVTTTDGRVLKAMVADFKGTPDNPLSREELREKFLMLTRHCDPAAMSGFFERLQCIEDEQSLEWISV